METLTLHIYILKLIIMKMIYNDSPLSLNPNECKYLNTVEFSNAIQSDNVSLSMLCINCRSLETHWDSVQ